MKRYGKLGAILGGAMAVTVFLQVFFLHLLPAQAQESSVEGAWELTVVSYSSGDKPRLAVVKHNAISGETRILTCDNRCDADEVWRDFAVAGPN